MAGNFGFPAYDGTGKRAFISYKESNMDAVAPIAAAIRSRGVNLWYDEGLRPGYKWEEDISRYFELSSVVIAFMSRDFFATQGYMRNEVAMAINRRKPMLIVFLDDLTIDDIDISDRSLWEQLSSIHSVSAVGESPETVADKLIDSIRKFIDADTRDIPALKEKLDREAQERASRSGAYTAPAPVSENGKSGKSFMLIGAAMLVMLALAVFFIADGDKKLAAMCTTETTPITTTGSTDPDDPTDPVDPADPTDPVSDTPSISEQLRGVTAGDYFEFGAYEQDNNLNNGKEPIRWLALEKSNGEIYAISEKCLDCMPYHNTLMDITWEKCSLRRWLNDDFLNSAFSPEEAGLLVNGQCFNTENPKYNTPSGPHTYDRVFCISVVERYGYFGQNADNSCSPTEYAKARGAEGDPCSWWLRTPGESEILAVAVFESGNVSLSGRSVDRGGVGVRPVIRIDVS